MISTSDLTQIVTVFVSVIGLFCFVVLGQSGDCRMRDTEINVSKNLKIPFNGGYSDAFCVGTFTVKSCEGTCESNMTPSVVMSQGYKKNCFCCKDSTTASRTVTLTCSTHQVEVPHEYTITGITACSCQRCD